MNNTEQNPEQTPEQMARRRLLKMAGYVPPALLGTVLLSKPAAGAAGLCPKKGGPGFVSAPAGTCCPCAPLSTQYNAQNCCQNYCNQAACSDYAASGSPKRCKRLNSWCGGAVTLPAACNCCIDRRGRFECERPGRRCP